MAFWNRILEKYNPVAIDLEDSEVVVSFNSE